MALLGPPGADEWSWLQTLPFFSKMFGTRNVFLLPASSMPRSLPSLLRESPLHLADLVEKALQWMPAARMTAASASKHKFLLSPPMSVCVDCKMGQNGIGSIVSGSLDEDVLAYLQGCPTLAVLVAEALDNVDATCKTLGDEWCDAVITSNRLSFFTCAFRRIAKSWLNQLTSRIRAEIKRQGLPDEYLGAHGLLFLNDLTDNAFMMHASIQVLKCGGREDRHIGRGTSLLHAALTLFGTRRMDVKCGNLSTWGTISLHQKPGSFYMGNLCALSHNVVHDEHPTGTYVFGDEHYGSRRLQIAVMLRSDVSRNARARKINAIPGPAELFHIVNRETAKHLAEQPLHLPDLAAVIS